MGKTAYIAFTYFWVHLTAWSSPDLLTEKLSRLTQQIEEQKIQAGIVVEDPQTHTIVFQKNPHLLLNPASNIKLFTVATALDVLKPDFKFKTEFYLSGDDLIIKGYGDPTLVTERIQLIARELYLLGIKNIKGNLVVDESYFDENNHPEGYSNDEDPDRAYVAPINALSCNFNAVSIYVRPGEQGKTVVDLDLPIGYLQLKKSVVTLWEKPTQLQFKTEPCESKTCVSVQGKLQASEAPKRYYRKIYDPPRYFASTLDYFLGLNGVATSHRIIKGKVPEKARLVYTDFSPPLSSVAASINQYSNNYMAEMLVKALGAQKSTPANFKDGLATIQTFAEDKLGIKKQDFKLGNGSGLNTANSVSAYQLTQLLVYMYNNFELSTEFMGSLGVAGASGTVKGRFKNSDIKRKMRAKTGSLPRTGVSSLAGYVSETDKTLAFVILLNKPGGNYETFWRFEKAFVEILNE